MKQGPSNRRARGRGVNRRPHGGGNSRSNVFDSNGPDVRIRGNAFQVYEKYMALARDASSSGDRVSMENYYQHAEHYHRIVNANATASANANADGEDGEQRDQRGKRNGNWRNRRDQNEESASAETAEQPSESELRGDQTKPEAKESKDSAPEEGDAEKSSADESPDSEAVQA